MVIGDLIFVKGDTLIDQAIDWAEHGIFSHVAVYVGEGRVIEAQGMRRVGYRNLKDYEGRYVVGHIEADNYQQLCVLDYLHSQIGRRYGWKTIILLAFNLVLHMKCKYNRDSGIICCVLANNAWRSARLPLVHKRIMTVQELADSAKVHLEKEGMYGVIH